MNTTTCANVEVEVDAELIATAMRRYQLCSKREVVEFALRRLVGPQLTPSFLAELRGIGWEGNLDEMREGRTYDLD